MRCRRSATSRAAPRSRSRPAVMYAGRATAARPIPSRSGVIALLPQVRRPLWWLAADPSLRPDTVVQRTGRSMKKLINDPADVVAEALRGIEAAHPELRVDHQNQVVFRADAPGQGKVGLVSGGGSGHEPMHGGFVGRGMLDAACAGEVFTSPVPDQVVEATRGVDGGAGVLHVVKNYTGDVMNFEMAAELVAAESGYGGRRGRGHRRRRRRTGQHLHRRTPRSRRHRAAGEDRRCRRRAGPGLEEVADVARAVNGPGRSMGIALTSCTVPAAGQADVRPARGRDGARRRHPRRAGPRAGARWPLRGRSPRCWWSRCWPTSPSPAATR